MKSMNIERSAIALLLAFGAVTAVPAVEPQPDPMLAVDQNRWTVVDRVVSEWGDRLAVSTAGLPRTALREMLESLRADHLLAASLAGSLDGLRDVLARALTATEGPEARQASAKAIGDTTQDLVYTPVVPCRIVDTRAAGGALQPMAPRVFDGYNAVSFAFQGGKSTNCGIPNGIAALAMNVYAVNPTNVGLIKVWPQGQPEPDVSTVNYQAGLVAIATGTIVPVNTASLNRFNAQSPAVVDFIADVVGYFKSARGGDGAVEIVVAAGRAVRLESTASSPNIIEGSAANSVQSGRVGATIGGGGQTGTDVVIDATTYACGAAGCANRVLDPYGTVNGGAANTSGGIESSGESQFNSFATVGGGFKNTANARYAAVGGGSGNSVGAEAGTVGGGAGNSVLGYVSYSGGHATTYFGPYGTIGGGQGNAIVGTHVTIGGGYQNGTHTTPYYPYSNRDADYATIAGGRNNSIYATDATVGGGSSNTITVIQCVAVGWCGDYATIGGGYKNETRGSGSTISGGTNNVAIGSGSTVPGGSGNSAGGPGSFAAGTRAKVYGLYADGSGGSHHGVFLWADRSSFDFVSSVPNEFAARATGGVRFVTAINGTTGAPTGGVYVAAGGGSWSSLSDRAAKKDLAPVDPQQVLEKVAVMPLYSWRYISEVSGALHVGPTAQDFRTSFGLGDSERHITSVDIDGIALAAIQGLHREARRKDAELAAQREIIGALEARLRVLEAGAASRSYRE